MNILELIKQYGLILIIVIAVASCCYFKIAANHYRTQRDNLAADNKVLQIEITKQNDAVEKMHHQWVDQVAKEKAAQKQAADIKAQYDKSVNDILNTAVSTECDSAVKWGAIQGPVLYSQWLAD